MGVGTGGVEGAFNEVRALGSGRLMWGFVYAVRGLDFTQRVRGHHGALYMVGQLFPQSIYEHVEEEKSAVRGFPWVPHERGVPGGCVLSWEVCERERLGKLSGRHASRQHAMK